MILKRLRTVQSSDLGGNFKSFEFDDKNTIKINDRLILMMIASVVLLERFAQTWIMLSIGKGSSDQIVIKLWSNCDQSKDSPGHSTCQLDVQRLSWMCFNFFQFFFLSVDTFDSPPEDSIWCDLISHLLEMIASSWPEDVLTSNPLTCACISITRINQNHLEDALNYTPDYHWNYQSLHSIRVAGIKNRSAQFASSRLNASHFESNEEHSLIKFNLKSIRILYQTFQLLD